MKFQKACLTLVAFATISFDYASCEIGCESLMTFTVYKESKTNKWESGSKLSDIGCNTTDEYTILIHGFGDPMLGPLVEKFLKFRGGCVINVNYEKCVSMRNYLVTLTMWRSVPPVLTQRLKDMEKEGIPPENILVYGFSLGARIAIESALSFGKGKLGALELCDPAGMGLDMFLFRTDANDVAKNVQCIYTSAFVGPVNKHECHQNWLMGNCGSSQPGNFDIKFMLDIMLHGHSSHLDNSHFLCNSFYASAFDHDFKANNKHHCNVRIPSNMPPDFKMGYMEPRKNSGVRGVFACPSTAVYPYNQS